MKENILLLMSSVVALLLMQIETAEANDDLAYQFCNRVCWDENALGQECETLSNCAELPRRRQNRCVDRCNRNATRCWDFCRENFQAIIDVCFPVCDDLDVYEHCMLECFIDRALTMKSRREGRVRPLPPTAPPPPETAA